MKEIFWTLFWGVFGFSFGTSVGLIMINATLWIIENLNGLGYKFLWLVKMKKTSCPHCRKEITWESTL